MRRRPPHERPPLQPLHVSVHAGGETVTVTVSYVNTTDAPLIGSALADVTLTATATMHVERAVGRGQRQGITKQR